eukprot:3634689-Rhodomonas_salina.2
MSGTYEGDMIWDQAEDEESSKVTMEPPQPEGQQDDEWVRACAFAPPSCSTSATSSSTSSLRRAEQGSSSPRGSLLRRDVLC